MRVLIIFIIYISISLSNSCSEFTDCILKVEGTPKCPPKERKTVDLKIESRETWRPIASASNDCDKKISVEAKLSYFSATSYAYWARFYYFRGGFYTRKIPEECIKGLQRKDDTYYCNIGIIDPSKNGTSSTNKPYIL
uniref:Uncharacterized protein n=1 Tax=Strongyloides papillosus TaxID=174720 RepID=A0A0N5BHB3_STREA